MVLTYVVGFGQGSGLGPKVNGLDLGSEFDPKFNGLKYVGL